MVEQVEVHVTIMTVIPEAAEAVEAVICTEAAEVVEEEGLTGHLLMVDWADLPIPKPVEAVEGEAD
jgi:hypothetical protein